MNGTRTSIGCSSAKKKQYILSELVRPILLRYPASRFVQNLTERIFNQSEAYECSGECKDIEPSHSHAAEADTRLGIHLSIIQTIS